MKLSRCVVCWIASAVLACAALAQESSPAPAVQDPAPALPEAPKARTAPWPERVLELAESLPVQDGGRVKPLSTYASFTLLRLSGKRSLTTHAGEKLKPTAWLLDVLFFPEAAAREDVFLVQDSAAMDAIGVHVDAKRKRDRYTFEELRPGLGKLISLAHEYDRIDSKQRTALQQEVVRLAHNVHAFEGLRTNFDWARRTIPVASGTRVASLFEGRAEVTFSDAVDAGPELLALSHTVASDGAVTGKADRDALIALDRAVSEMARDGESLALIAPAEGGPGQEWYTPMALLSLSFGEGRVSPQQIEALRGLDRLTRAAGDPAAFERELGGVQTTLVGLATDRGDYEKIPLERGYYKSGLLHWSQGFYVLAFLTAAFLWMRPGSKLLHRGAGGLTLLATFALCAAIVVRCMIRGRPPVSTLYETVLFVTATGSLVALVMEWIHRQRIAVSVAAALGLIGIFIANGYETLDKQDTMPSLVAVLDTNFWLATHVTAITIGYSAGLLAALLANVWIVMKILRRKKSDPEFYRSLARMVYGVICFGVIFATVGTILGGIWANESWGRFWGWDPKENGALLIVISQIALLHGRMNGWLRDFGVCQMAAFGGTVIAFSWWGVNLLGVGLHSYGFTSGIATALWTYYGLQWGLCALGFLAWWLERRRVATTGAVELAGR